MKINRIDLTADEAAWFSRNVLAMLRNMEKAATKDPGILSRTTYKTLNSLRLRAEDIGKIVEGLSNEDVVIEVSASRKQKLIISDLVSAVHKTLVERTIPEYERRGADYVEYLKKAQAKAEFLNVIRRKFK